jgi:hypothetical protein
MKRPTTVFCREKSLRIATAVLARIAPALTLATAQAALANGLESPDIGVVCNRTHSFDIFDGTC